MLNVFFSNRTESLVEPLKAILFSQHTNPFTRRMIIVPSPAMKTWLMMQIARDPQLQVAAGLEISYLDQSLKTLRQQLYPNNQAKELSSDELAFAIERHLRLLIDCRMELIGEAYALWQPVLDYLHAGHGQTWGRKGENRLVNLRDELAQLFMRYGLHAGEMAMQWEVKPSLHWQAALWKQIFESGEWTYPCKEIRLCAAAPHPEPLLNIQIHLFAMSYVPKIYHEFLSYMSQAATVAYYMLSPCQAFWTDLLSDRQSHYLQNHWKEQKAPEAQQLALEEFLRERNPLLANFGRIGREMAMHIEAEGIQTAESYTLSEHIQSDPIYSELCSNDLFYDVSGKRLTLLTAIQADMALLRTPKASNKVDLELHDESIQLHAAPNKMREIQILYDALLKTLHCSDSSSPIVPGDIIVMIPDIHNYIPYIKAVFESSDSVLDIIIMDCPVPESNPFVQAFLHLLSLPLTRWDAVSILKLLDFPHIRSKQQFSHEESKQIREWIKETGARWGHDSRHREELMQRDHEGIVMPQLSTGGTWECAFSKLLNNLMFEIHSEDSRNGIEFNQGELLGRWISVMRSLKSDLECLQDGTKRTLKDWALYLESLVEAYLDTEADKESGKILLNLFEKLPRASQVIQDDALPFSSVYGYLQKNLSQQVTTYKDNALQAIRFCALLPMRAIPAKVIAMAGMNEGAFPRRNAHNSLDMTIGCKYGFIPSSTDYDRFLFLEALLSARQYLIITYPGYDLRDTEEQQPSLLVSELIAYLDKGYLLNGKTPSEICCKKHPYHQFDASYFLLDSKLSTFSKSSYESALAYYGPKDAAPAFIKRFHIKRASDKKQLSLNIRDLSGFAKNPLKRFFNKSLGIYLTDLEDKKFKKDEDFGLSRLQLSYFKKQALRQDVDCTLQIAERLGRLPEGPFKSMVIENIRQETNFITNQLAALGVGPEELFSFSLSDQCKDKEQVSANKWQFPAITINTQDFNIKITGQLSDICPAGLLGNISDRKSEVIKAWPQFLICSYLIQHYQLPIARQMVFLKDGKPPKEAFFDDAGKLLENYMSYYLAAAENPSPLIPEWVEKFLGGDNELFAAFISRSLNDTFNPLYNHYATWMFRGKQAHSGVCFKDWKQHASLVYGDLCTYWYPPRKGSDNETV